MEKDEKPKADEKKPAEVKLKGPVFCEVRPGNWQIAPGVTLLSGTIVSLEGKYLDAAMKLRAVTVIGETR